MTQERKPAGGKPGGQQDDTKLVSPAAPVDVALRLLPRMTAEQLQRVIAVAQELLRQRKPKGK
jgi:hypothetical protein